MTWATDVALANRDIIDAFGVSGVYLPIKGLQSTVTVNFTRESRTLDTENGSLTTYDAMLEAVATDMPDVQEGDQITIGGTLYRFAHVEEDADGLLSVMLTAAA